MNTNLRSLLQAALLLITLFGPAKRLLSQTTETFESFSLNATSYTSSSTAFTLSPTGAIVDQLTGFGYLSSNKYISNSVNNADPCQIKSVNATYTMKSLYLYPSSSAIGSTNSTSNVVVTFTGKLAGVTKFTYTPPSADFSAASYSNATNRGFSLVNFATPGYDNISIDELVVDLGGTMLYWAIDNFTYVGTPAAATITKTASLTSFTSCSSTVSAAQNFTIGGSNLTAGITVTAPTGFEVSTSAGSGYSGSLIVPQTAGAVSTTTIYTRLTASASGTPSGNITCTSTGATTQNIAVTGTVASVTVNLAALTTVSCNGGSNGAATVGTPAGGAAPYTYNWTPGNPTGDGTNTVTGLTPGLWTCTVTDANGCVATRIATVTQPSAINVTAASQTNIACNSGATGAAAINAATGGAGGYTYNWTPGNPTGDGTTSVSGLTAGTWTCTVTDANGCTATRSFTITQPTVLSATAASQTNIACNGGATGAAAINAATGGAGGYTYNWTPGNPTGDGTTSVSGLTAGTWTCTVTDANGCTATNSFTVTQPTVLSATASSQTNISCFGGSNGTASVTPSGGTPGYTYSWSPSGGTAASATGLSAGTYICTVTDANGCTATRSFTITQPAAISVATGSQTNISCFGGSNGTASVTPSGGTPGYTYSWSPSGGTAATATGRTAGTYVCTVTDANGCTATRSFTITQPAAISVATGSQTNISCFGGSNGTASVTPSGGTPGYTYSWSPSGGTAATATGLAAGIYVCTVTDANGCTATRSFTITQPSVISVATGSQSNVSCFGGSNGTASVTPSGGTPGYTYSWSPSGGTAATATGLTSGTFVCTVTDANGCTATRSFTITQPAAISVATGSQTNISCFGGSNGVASVTPSGGTPGYTYSWSPSGGTAATATGRTAGTYICTVTDANGCTATRSFTITQPSVISVATGSQTNVSCFGGSNGVASVTPSGGTPGYTYSWSPSGGTGATATGLSAGSYVCTVTDANGCTATRSFTVTQTAAINVNASSQTNIACNGGATGAAAVNAATGGAGGYTYNWTPGNPTGDGTTSVTGLTAGTWTCTVTDANGCTATRSFTVTQPTALTAGTSQTNVSCSGSSTGNATVSPAGGMSPYTYAWSPSGGSAALAANLVAGTYSCIITDSYGCSISKSFTITQTQSTPGSASYQLPATNKTYTGPVLDQNFVTGSCELINTVTASGASPAIGSLTNKVWIESTVPTLGSVETPFVQRHYEITPAVNPTTATATVTLYFTQAEFDAFNAHSGSVLDLPKNPTDSEGKSNLRIGKYSGSSSNQTGLPGSYTSSAIVLDPVDTDIVWNSTSSAWEISFAVSGFSGFIVQTNQFVLPVSWSSFDAVKQGRSVLLSWNTGTELNTKSFLVQHSTNGTSFSSLSSVDAKGNTGNTNKYNFSHTAPANGTNYYRIAQQDQDGKYNYSKTIRIDFYNAATSLVRLLSNPVSNGSLNLQLTKTTAVDLYSNDGKLVLHAKLNEGIQHIDVSRLAKGIYMLTAGQENIKVLIQ